MFSLIILVIAVVSCQQNICGNTQIKIFNFDDVIVTDYSGYRSLPRPYNSLIFKRVNTIHTSYSDNNIPVLNITNNNTLSYYVNAATSSPNLILTTGESLSIREINNGTFAVLNLKMKSIYINQMNVFINTFRFGNLVSNMTVNLPVNEPIIVNVNQKQFDEILIGCVDPSFNTCAHITYDDISFCRI